MSARKCYSGHAGCRQNDNITLASLWSLVNLVIFAGPYTPFRFGHAPRSSAFLHFALNASDVAQRRSLFRVTCSTYGRAYIKQKTLMHVNAMACRNLQCVYRPWLPLLFKDFDFNLENKFKMIRSSAAESKFNILLFTMANSNIETWKLFKWD